MKQNQSNKYAINSCILQCYLPNAK